MNDYKFETNGRSVAYNGKLETSMDFAPPAKDQQRAIDNHNIMIKNESRLVWKEAYLSFYMLPATHRPITAGRYITPTEYADQAASNYFNSWSKK